DAFNVATQKMRSGCVNNAGTGYYTFEINSSATHPETVLWYYDIGGNTWTKVANSFRNGATDYTASFKSLNSGDMAFDANGNLWVVISNYSNNGLYKIANTAIAATRASG